MKLLLAFLCAVAVFLCLVAFLAAVILTHGAALAVLPVGAVLFLFTMFFWERGW